MENEFPGRCYLFLVYDGMIYSVELILKDFEKLASCADCLAYDGSLALLVEERALERHRSADPGGHEKLCLLLFSLYL